MKTRVFSGLATGLEFRAYVDSGVPSQAQITCKHWSQMEKERIAEVIATVQRKAVFLEFISIFGVSNCS